MRATGRATGRAADEPTLVITDACNGRRGHDVRLVHTHRRNVPVRELEGSRVGVDVGVAVRWTPRARVGVTGPVTTYTSVSSERDETRRDVQKVRLMMMLFAAKNWSRLHCVLGKYATGVPYKAKRCQRVHV